MLSVIAATLAVTLSACNNEPSKDEPVQVGIQAACYHDWTAYFKSPAGDTLRPINSGILSGPGEAQNVPLYHDCQRFVTGSSYGALFAIFATQRVTDLGALGPTMAIPVVEIVALADYAPLEIRAGYNCVYLYGSTTAPRAKIVNFGGVEKDCRMDVSVTSLAVSPSLQVMAEATPGFTAGDDDIPPVARWDWDATNQKYYIGVKCLRVWCEIGGSGFRPSQTVLQRLPAAMVSALPLRLKRNYAIKGWYDEQLLAVPSGGTKPEPSQIRGTVIPDPELGTRVLGDFRDRWTLVAQIMLDVPGAATNPYLEKFNFAHTQPGEFNKLELCHSTSNGCPGLVLPTCSSAYNAASMSKPQEWWARITRVDGRIEYRCVLAHAPPAGFPVTSTPKSARWHWLDSDDIIWEWCPVGCCEEWSK